MPPKKMERINVFREDILDSTILCIGVLETPSYRFRAPSKFFLSIFVYLVFKTIIITYVLLLSATAAVSSNTFNTSQILCKLESFRPIYRVAILWLVNIRHIVWRLSWIISLRHDINWNVRPMINAHLSCFDTNHLSTR